MKALAKELEILSLVLFSNTMYAEKENEYSK